MPVLSSGRSEKAPETEAVPEKSPATRFIKFIKFYTLSLIYAMFNWPNWLNSSDPFLPCFALYISFCSQGLGMLNTWFSHPQRVVSIFSGHFQIFLSSRFQGPKTVWTEMNSLSHDARIVSTVTLWDLMIAPGRPSTEPQRLFHLKYTVLPHWNVLFFSIVYNQLLFCSRLRSFHPIKKLKQGVGYVAITPVFITFFAMSQNWSTTFGPKRLWLGFYIFPRRLA